MLAIAARTVADLVASMLYASWRVRILQAASALAFIVWATHYGTIILSLTYGNPIAAQKALFYIAQAIKGCFLWLAIASLLPPRAFSIPMWAVCAWGIFEDSQAAVCRMARDIDTVPVVGPWAGLCEGNWTVYGLAVGLIACSAIAYGVRRGSN